MFVVASSAVVGFLSVLIGRWLHLDYSAKLWAMTFVLVVMVRTFSNLFTISPRRFGLYWLADQYFGAYMSACRFVTEDSPRASAGTAARDVACCTILFPRIAV